MRKISVRLKDGGSFMWYGKDSRSIWVRPRLALAPWVGSGFFTSFLMGFPFAPIRQFLGLLQLPLLYKYWHSIPKQFYSLDDAAEKIPAFFFFRLSSIFLSFAIVTLVWGAAFRLVSQFARSSNFRYRNVFVFGLVMIFQIGDIFVIHFSR